MTTLAFIGSGTVFGLAAGLTPGPLFTLVLTQALRHGTREGIKVALAPLLTDLPIVLVAVFVFARLSSTEPVLGGIALIGGGFLAYLAYDSFAFVPDHVGLPAVESDSLRKGVLANLLNPHPYLFWFAVGAPTLIRASEVGRLAVAGFLIAMYGCLVGSKILLAVAAGQGRTVLTSRAYVVVVRALGLALAGFALLFLSDAFRYFC